MIAAAEAQDLILRETVVLGPKTISLRDSLGGYLFHPVISPSALPPFDNSAMDGFALRSSDTKGASGHQPVPLKVVGTTAAGDLPLSIQSDEAVRIMTGAPIPSGADTVVPFEETLETPGCCLIQKTPDMGQHIRRAGEDVAKGSELLKSGDKITSRTVALLAAVGIDRVEVYQKPRVCVLSTGSELVDVGAGSPRPGTDTAPLQPGQIYNSNGPALEMALQELGIAAQVLKTANDTEGSLEKSLRDHLDVDVWITVGGVSAGDFDLVPKVLQKLGTKILFHKVAIKPGKPLLFATYAKGEHGGSPLHIFALPGNPVSALVVFDQFVRPALLKMMGSNLPYRSRKTAVAIEDLKGSEGKEDYLRGIATYRDGRYEVRSAGSQGSARLLPLALANVTIIIPSSVKKVTAGEKVEIEFFQEKL